MNKTVNINLGGIFFHIDEDAYQKLSRYFDAIKRSLSNSAGQDEIIKDIEMRIAELVSEKHTHDKQVISLKELDEIIAIMGQPEDYRLENDEPETAEPAYQYPAGRRLKKLYRDPEKGMLGGVCAGLGHYFGVDAVWLRIIFVILLFGYGIGLVPYIVLWIVMPAAITTAEKLEMTGEPVTIANIEKKVREEAQALAERYGNPNFGKSGKQVKTGFERAAGGVGSALGSVFKVFAKILGAFIVTFSAAVLVGMLIALFTVGSTSLVDVPWQPYLDSVNYTGAPVWLVALLFFFAIGIPVFFFFLLGLKLLSKHVRSIGSVAKYTLVGLWALAVAGLIIWGVKQATEIAYTNKEVIKENIDLKPGDTLKIKFRYDDYFAKDIYHRHEYLFTQNAEDKEVIYSNNVRFYLKYTDERTPYIQIEKNAKGRSTADARERARDIKYGFSVQGNEIVLDNFLLMDKDRKYREQEVLIFLYLPKGTLFKADDSVREFNFSTWNYFHIDDSGSYLYQVSEDKVQCLDCPPDEDIRGIDEAEEAKEVETVIEIGGAAADTVTKVIVDGKVILDAKGAPKGLEVGPDGTIIKKK